MGSPDSLSHTSHTGSRTTLQSPASPLLSHKHKHIKEEEETERLKKQVQEKEKEEKLIKEETMETGRVSIGETRNVSFMER